MTCLRFLTLLFVAALCSNLAQAQTAMDGLWQITLTPPDQPAMKMKVHAETVSDTLHLVLLMEEDTLVLTDVALSEKQLRFKIPSGHGVVHCTLHKKDADTFTGICAGAMGEGATTLKRVVEE
ncbi:MAG TPA: hypothetical protein VKP65_09590 [Rhodothermales bacterium]|nr:hypothetical protein [Rhodothermales bacterium]